MTYSASDVFCDWLDVTYPPDQSPVDSIRLWLDGLLCPVRYSDDETCLVDVGSGVLAIQTKSRFHRISASGAVLSHLRDLDLFHTYLDLLGSMVHKVTRLDAARDYYTDAPPFLRHLEAKYPDDRVNLQRKALKVTRMYSSRSSDGAQTGTWYVGHRSSARVSCRVYDKQAQSLDVLGISIPPTTRVEFTFRKDHGCTLRDAAMPYSLYHEYASPKVVPKPADAQPWSPHGEGWTARPVDTAIPFEVFRKRVEFSPEIERLAELAAGFGPEGRDLLLRVFQRRVDAIARGNDGSPRRAAGGGRD